MTAEQKQDGYYRQFMKHWKQAIDSEMQIEDVKHVVFSGVKWVALAEPPPGMAETMFECVQIINAYIGKLTPQQFLNIFPPRKDFNGHKRECKDYFSTMEAVRELPTDQPIGDNALEFLWDYMNWDVCSYVVAGMGYLSDLRRSQGMPGLAEEFFGDAVCTLHTTEDGKQYLHDPKTGKLTRVFPVRPFKLLEGGK